MSIKAMTYVWARSKQKGSALVMMLAIADMANDDGDCWPGVGTLAKKTRMSERNAQKLIRKLEAAGEVIVHQGDGVETAHGNTNRYTLIMPTEVNAVTPQRRQRRHPRGERGDTPEASEATPQGVNAVTPNPTVFEPSVEPSVEPSSSSDSQESSSSSPPTMTTIDRKEPTPESPVLKNTAPTQRQIDAWTAAYGQLEIQLDRFSFETWLRGGKLLGMDGEVWVIGVKNNYAKDMCQHRLYRNIRRVLGDCLGESVELRFEALPVSPLKADEDMALWALVDEAAQAFKPPGEKPLTMDDARTIAKSWGADDVNKYAAKVFQGWIESGKVVAQPAGEGIV